MSLCRLCEKPCKLGKGNGRFCSVECRFYSKVKKANFCWEWTGARISKRYGGMQFGKENRPAHRASWQIHFGEIPGKMNVLHRCDNVTCVNPDHLFLGTHQDNMDDKAMKKRCVNNPKRTFALDKHQEIISLFKSGKNQIEIARIYGTYRNIIYLILRKHGVYEKRNKKIQPTEQWKVLSLFNDGFKRKEIAEIFQCSEANIKKTLEKLRNQKPENKFPNG